MFPINTIQVYFMPNIFNIIRKDYRFVLLFFLWGVSSFFPLMPYLVVGGSLFYFLKKRDFDAIILGMLLLFIFSDNRSYSFSYARSFKIAYLIIVFMFVFVSYGREYLLHSFFRSFLPFFALCGVALILSPIFFVSLQKTLSYMILIWTVPVLIQESIRQDQARLVIRLVIFFFCFLSLSLIVYVFNKNLVAIIGNRYHSFLGNPNGLGIYSTLSAIALFFSANIKSV